MVQNHLTPTAWPVPGASSRQVVFQKMLEEYTVPPGDEAQQHRMNQHRENGSADVAQEKNNPFQATIYFTTSQST